MAGVHGGASRTPTRMERIGAFCFAWRNVLFSGVVILLLAVLQPVPFLGSPKADRWCNLAGFVIAAAGQVLRAAVIGFAYVKRGGKDRKVYADNLVTVGFFNHCRNPLYVGNILILTGLVVVHNHPLAYLVLPAAWFGYSAIVAAEEAYLAQRFGDEYAEYCRRVPRWQLRLWGLRASLAGMRFQWRTVVDKEHTTTYSWLAGILAILTYEVLAWHAVPSSVPFLEGVGATFAILTLAWGAAFYWKKTGRRRRRAAQAAARG